jgi:hypothetical protein
VETRPSGERPALEITVLRQRCAALGRADNEKRRRSVVCEWEGKVIVIVLANVKRACRPAYRRDGIAARDLNSSVLIHVCVAAIEGVQAARTVVITVVQARTGIFSRSEVAVVKITARRGLADQSIDVSGLVAACVRGAHVLAAQLPPGGWGLRIADDELHRGQSHNTQIHSRVEGGDHLCPLCEVVGTVGREVSALEGVGAGTIKGPAFAEKRPGPQSRREPQGWCAGRADDKVGTLGERCPASGKVEDVARGAPA